jgi:long-subunit fatty acid transport protein
MNSASRHFARVLQTPRVALVFLSVLLQLLPGFCVAQEAPPALEFNFSNPGARSMGLGGAFVALADDATAAFANPAGLVQLLRPEVTLELRTRRYSTPYTEGGRAVGEPTGLGIDTVDGLRFANSEDTTSGVSFASFVYPGNRWSLALYRHQLADFTLGTEVNGLFGDVPEGGTRRNEDQLSSTELDIVGTGVSAAYQLSDRISLGFGIAYYSGDVENEASVYWIDSYPDTFWESNSFFPENRVTTSTFLIDGTDLGFNAGFLWKFADSWRLGGVYRQGPRFDYDLYTRAGPAHHLPDGTILDSVTDHSIAFPDVWGLGVTYRSPDGSLTAGFEWDRVEYSIIKETLDSPLADTSLVAIDDADEIHLGVEYVFLKSNPLIAVRGGLWHDPDHRFRYIGDDPFEQALFPPGEDALHIAIGVGIAVKAFQIDLGVDLSENSDVFALSAIYSF